MAPYKAELHARIAGAYADGAETRDLAREHGLSPRQVIRICREQGVPPREQRPQAMTFEQRVETGRRRSRDAQGYDRDYLGDCLRMAAAELGGVPTIEEYRRFAQEWHLPSAARVVQVFRRWNDGVAHAGLEPHKPPRYPYTQRFPYEACLEALRECAREVGRPPTYAEYERWQQEHRTGRSDGAYPSATLIRHRSPAGTFVDALADAFRPEGDVASDG